MTCFWIVAMLTNLSRNELVLLLLLFMLTHSWSFAEKKGNLLPAEVVADTTQRTNIKQPIQFDSQYYGGLFSEQPVVIALMTGIFTLVAVFIGASLNRRIQH